MSRAFGDGGANAEDAVKDKASRRDFLRGHFAKAPQERAPSPPQCPSTSQAPLPRVIAWLNDPAPADSVATRHAVFPLLRPPGAIVEAQFLRDCTRCDACIEACPHDALRRAPARYRQAQGTPFIEPGTAPCRLCEDWPCIRACPEGVLVLEGAGVMGTARVQQHDCLNSLGTSCNVCVEQCPVPGAIMLRGSSVVVNAAMCTGCGICSHVCPAPNNAVIILPAAQRPEKIAIHAEEHDA